MLKNVPFKVRKHRHPHARVMKPAGPTPLEVTAILGVQGTPEGMEVRLAVDATEADPVDVGAADPLKWSLMTSDSFFQGQIVNAAAYNELLIVLAWVGAGGGSSYVGYTANPSDIATESGRALGAFTRALG